MGIILFNILNVRKLSNFITKKGFRPLMGIILFNNTGYTQVILKHHDKEFPSPNGDYFI